MTEAIFGLLGVVIGGVLTGVVQFLLDRHREIRACKSAARLAMGPLMRAQIEVHDMLTSERWDAVINERVSLTRWKETQDLFAQTLEYTLWLDIHNAHRGIEQALDAADRWDDQPIDPEHADQLDRTVHKAIEGAVHLAILGEHGPRRLRLSQLRGRLWHRFRKRSDDDLLAEAMDRVDPRRRSG